MQSLRPSRLPVPHSRTHTLDANTPTLLYLDYDSSRPRSSPSGSLEQSPINLHSPLRSAISLPYQCYRRSPHASLPVSPCFALPLVLRSSHIDIATSTDNCSPACIPSARTTSMLLYIWHSEFLPHSYISQLLIHDSSRPRSSPSPSLEHISFAVGLKTRKPPWSRRRHLHPPFDSAKLVRHHQPQIVQQIDQIPLTPPCRRHDSRGVVQPPISWPSITG